MDYTNFDLDTTGTNVAILVNWREAHFLQCQPVAMLDSDLDAMSRDELVAEVKKLRAGIRAHRDSSGHDLCWHHPALWGLLPDRTDPLPKVPSWPQFLRGCVRYRQSIDEQIPDAPRTDEEYQGEGETEVAAGSPASR